MYTIVPRGASILPIAGHSSPKKQNKNRQFPFHFQPNVHLYLSLVNFVFISIESFLLHFYAYSHAIVERPFEYTMLIPAVASAIARTGGYSHRLSHFDFGFSSFFFVCSGCAF